jgi:hypothetical protein
VKETTVIYQLLETPPVIPMISHKVQRSDSGSRQWRCPGRRKPV